MYLGDLSGGIGLNNKDEKRKELTELANQPSMFAQKIPDVQKWLDRKGPNCRIESILGKLQLVKIPCEQDYEGKFKSGLTPEIVDQWNTP